MKDKPSKYLYKLALLSELLSKNYAMHLSKTLGVPYEELLNSKPVQKYYDKLRHELDKMADKWSNKKYNHKKTSIW